MRESCTQKKRVGGEQKLEAKERFSEAASRKEGEKQEEKIQAAKKERNAERKRKTEELSREAKEEDLRKKRQKKVRHEESQLFSIPFSHH